MHRPAPALQRHRFAIGAKPALMPLAALCLFLAQPLTCWSGSGQVSATTAESRAVSVERGVKAAYLYKFLGYVEFPTAALEPGASYVIGVIGADDIATELARIAVGRNINNHPVAVRVLRAGDPVVGVHLLFAGEAESTATVSSLMRSAQQAGALGVTDAAGLRVGSVINFRLIEDRIRFEVSLEAADKSNLKLSSRLLSVAYVVQKGGS